MVRVRHRLDGSARGASAAVSLGCLGVYIGKTKVLTPGTVKIACFLEDVIQDSFFWGVSSGTGVSNGCRPGLRKQMIHVTTL